MALLDGHPATADDLQSLATLNYGHFTSMLVEEQRVRGLALHLRRLADDCRALFAVDLDRETVRDRIRQAVAGRRGACVVRVTVYDPALPLGRPGAEASPRVLVTTRPAAGGSPPPARVRSAQYGRDRPDVKHVGLFGAIDQRRRAQRAGFDDALFVDAEQYVSEGPTWNVGFSDGERVIWPDAAVLPGVTMRLLQEAYAATTTARVPLGEAGAMRVAFMTNAAIGVRPLAGVDAVEYPVRHPVLEALRAAYRAIPGEPL